MIQAVGAHAARARVWPAVGRGSLPRAPHTALSGRPLGTPRPRVPKPGRLPAGAGPLPAPTSPGSSRKPASQLAALRALAMAPSRSPAAAGALPGTSAGRPGHSPPLPPPAAPRGARPPRQPGANCPERPGLSYSGATPDSPPPPPPSPSAHPPVSLRLVSLSLPGWVDGETLSFCVAQTRPHFEAILVPQPRELGRYLGSLSVLFLPTQASLLQSCLPNQR